MQNPNRKQVPFFIWVILVAGGVGVLAWMSPLGDHYRPEKAIYKESDNTINQEPIQKKGMIDPITPQPTKHSKIKEEIPKVEKTVKELDQEKLSSVVKHWKYRGYFGLGPMKSGSFSKGTRKDKQFMAKEGEIIEGVVIHSLSSKEAIVCIGDASATLPLEDDWPRRTRSTGSLEPTPTTKAIPQPAPSPESKRKPSPKPQRSRNTEKPVSNETSFIR